MSSTYPVPLAKRASRSVQSTSSTARPQSNKSYVSSAPRRHRPPTSYSAAGTTLTSTTTFKKRQSIYATVSSSTESLCTGYTASCFTSSGEPAHSSLKSKKMRSSMPPMDSTEFDTLPPAIRRKYFSSLERLRYAQQQFSASPISVKPSHLRSLSSTSKSKPGRPSSDTFRSHTSGRHSKFRKHNNSTADAFVLSQTDAQWFLELPEAIQRKYFSPEEQDLLASKCKSIIVDATDETLYRMGQRNRSCSSLDSRGSSVSTIASLQRRSFDSDIENATEEVRKSFRWMDEDGDLDLQLRQFQEDSNNAAPVQTRKRRTLSLTKNMRTHSSSNSSETRNRMTGVNRRTASQSGFPRLSSTAKSSIESDAAYYQDPDARLKLRVYLASPQKFDEAIEFGFPSQTEANDFFQQSRPKDPTIRKVSATKTVEPVTDYLGDLSPIDDPTESDMSVTLDTDGRELPGSVRMRSIDSSSQCGPRPLLDHYPHSSPANREMTLRMTLTRKDLRATDTVAEKNPTALTMEELPPECSTIDWDAIDREAASGLKRLWRKVKGY